MAKSLAKVQKKISKKNKSTRSLHENSRDAQRLRRAGARSEKLERLAAARAKANQPLMQRVAFFQGTAKAATNPVDEEKIHSLIQKYLSRHNDELAELESQRRPGRPSSKREDMLKQSMETEDREYDTGYWIPDMTHERTLDLLAGWNEEWTSLNTLRYIRISRDGTTQQSNFPPRGLS